MMELFTRYDPTTPEEEREGSPVCVASYPEPCGERAVGEGWGCLPLCEAHWTEAELAAREDLVGELQNELENLVFAEAQRHHTNKAVVRALRGANVPGLEWELADSRAHDAALAAAYPTEGREDLTHPDTLAFDYDRYDRDGPLEWWSEERYLLLYFMRLACEGGLPRLVQDLEGLRERATVQLALAERDYELRFAAPRRAAREAKGRAGG
jgi:hypothetical protein